MFLPWDYIFCGSVVKVHREQRYYIDDTSRWGTLLLLSKA